MTISDTNALAAALAALATRAPDDLFDRVVDRWTRVAAPVDELLVAFGAVGIRFVRTVGSVNGDTDSFLRRCRDLFDRPLIAARRPPVGLQAAARLGRGQGLRFDLTAMSPFERDVLRATLRIPYGQTRTYGWVARESGRPGAVRAVAAVLVRNPVPVLVPCHRVLRADATTGGHVLGSAVKERLLRAEGVDLAGLRALARRGVHYLGSDTTGIVCFPTCHNARRITPQHQIGFSSTAAARDAGYRPCKACKPESGLAA